MASSIAIERALPADLPAIATLAAVIWRAHYPGIITPAQIEYMLERMYRLDVMQREMEEGVAYFRARADGSMVGFAACGKAEPGTYKLHKLYVHPQWQGQGTGKSLLRKVEAFARSQDGHILILNVNKRNFAAIAAYQRCGFTVRESLVIDIGGGFVMDDHVMAKALEP